MEDINMNIEISLNDFNIISFYEYRCQVCGYIIKFNDHPLDIDNIQCNFCHTNYSLKEVNELGKND